MKKRLFLVTLGSASLTFHTALLLLLAPLPFLVATDDREATVAAAWEPDPDNQA